jgi:hypothetical protein
MAATSKSDQRLQLLARRLWELYLTGQTQLALQPLLRAPESQLRAIVGDETQIIIPDAHILHVEMDASSIA